MKSKVENHIFMTVALILERRRGALRRNFCVNWKVRGISQEKIAGCEINKRKSVISERNKIMGVLFHVVKSIVSCTFPFL